MNRLESHGRIAWERPWRCQEVRYLRTDENDVILEAILSDGFRRLRVRFFRPNPMDQAEQLLFMTDLHIRDRNLVCEDDLEFGRYEAFLNEDQEFMEYAFAADQVWIEDLGVI
ncbi:MAG: hypothetical protein H6581_25710 [Bacteroidia bacterium]|nr:hypothetical protein [Bacteroidia bacterium]